MAKKIESQQKMKVETAHPACIRVDLVPVDNLNNYETFAWYGSLLSNFAIGFLVAVGTVSGYRTVLSIVAFAFTGLAALFLWKAKGYRKEMDGEKIIKTFEEK